MEVHATMLEDPSFVSNCKRRLSNELLTAKSAVLAEIHPIEKRFQEHEQQFMQARAADVRDIGCRVLSKLRGAGDRSPHPLASLTPGSVIVAEELLLSDALQINHSNVTAIVTSRTGPASHVAILARSRGIPAICDIDGATSLLTSGDYLLVDAEAGTITIAPTPAQARRFTLLRSQAAPFTHTNPAGSASSCETSDGVEIALHGNIGRADEAIIALEHGLDGIGLFRSEYLFLQRDEPPDLETQATAYAEVAAMLDPRPIVIRTMDLGGDKIPRFDNTTLDPAFRAGLRGLAYSLAENTMFQTQIDAIVRAARSGNVRMMFPMVMGAEDFKKARSLVDEAVQRECLGQAISVGAMIETPAAAFDIDRILDISDFVSIGTNDLAHYVLAMDRWTQSHSGGHSFFHPSVLRATHQVVQAARSKEVSLRAESYQSGSYPQALK
ncbi:phosphoenolpyruvate--protein phosphotransferase [Defluviicoccus vanus]|uniref:Phosphoenolpyruvate-protein phosphotransferase n=1 Tax=Defluviicoccus vanus TaxID=111831 RepID=A0A7H1N0C0_9PROT|nr:phosphoenolpyruvate--protein phosphotransferase [Defluviicoccus vanus]